MTGSVQVELHVGIKLKNIKILVIQYFIVSIEPKLLNSVQDLVEWSVRSDPVSDPKPDQTY